MNSTCTEYAESGIHFYPRPTETATTTTESSDR
jgi:hypothetical protein